MRPCEAVLDYIVVAQDPVGGGWRWCATARRHVRRWLATDGTEERAYGLFARGSGGLCRQETALSRLRTTDRHPVPLSSPGDGPATTAVGLLCHVPGLEPGGTGLQRGVDRISQSGPSPADMYYNYYATQVMRHSRARCGISGTRKGDLWWNRKSNGAIWQVAGTWARTIRR